MSKEFNSATEVDGFWRLSDSEKQYCMTVERFANAVDGLASLGIKTVFPDKLSDLDGVDSKELEFMNKMLETFKMWVELFNVNAIIVAENSVRNQEIQRNVNKILEKLNEKE